MILCSCMVAIEQMLKRQERRLWEWEEWVIIDFKNKMAFVHYTVHMNCTVHYNGCMAVKR